VQQFREGEEDDIKFKIFDNNRILWRTVEDEVRTWVTSRWDDWMAEKPEWLEVAAIPDDILPVGALAHLGGAKRRRSSVSIKFRSAKALPRLVGPEQE
jgi:hypothetical protein